MAAASLTPPGPYIVYMLQEIDILEDWAAIKKVPRNPAGGVSATLTPTSTQPSSLPGSGGEQSGLPLPRFWHVLPRGGEAAGPARMTALGRGPVTSPLGKAWWGFQSYWAGFQRASVLPGQARAAASPQKRKPDGKDTSEDPVAPRPALAARGGNHRA